MRKRQRRFEGFDDKILARHSRGLSTRDIEAHLQEIYGVQVGRNLISPLITWPTTAGRTGARPVAAEPPPRVSC